MFRIPFTSTHMEFTAPFRFLPTSLQPIALLILLAGTVYLFAHLYRLEASRVSRRVAFFLLVLRATAVIGVFLVWTTNPVAAWTVRAREAGRVIVAVDLSDSMRVNDPSRPVIEKLRLAQALGLHHGVAADESLLEWIQTVPRGGEPAFQSKPEKAAFQEVIRRCDRLTRLQCVELALASDGGALLDKLTSTDAVGLLGFARHRVELPSDGARLRAAIADQSPQSAFTDLNVPLTGTSRPSAVVLFTDGRHNFGEAPVARSLGEKGVAVYPVNVAPREPDSDVAIVSVTPAVTTACRGSSVPVTVEVRATHWPASLIRVELKLPGAASLEETIRHDGRDRIHEIVFHPHLERVGLPTLVVEAKPDRGDPRPENNTRSAHVRVVDDKPRVLLIEGEARWEYRFLRNALIRSREPELEVKSVVFQQPRIGTTTDAEAEKSGLPALKLPEGENALADFDCVILGDVSPEQLTVKDRERLEKYVADAGGSLIVMAGPRQVPLGLAENDPLRKLLPMRNSHAFAPPDGFVPELTLSGKRLWFLRLGDTDEQNRKTWGGFPPHQWAAVGEAKEGAEVLATPSGQPRAALLARQHYGFGRVLYLGIDSTWRWRFKNGNEHHDRFWRQVVHWAAAERILPARNEAGTIRFGPREPIYELGKSVDVLLRATETIPLLSAKAVAAVKLIRLNPRDGKDEVMGLAPLQQADGRPRELAATLRDLPPGRYAIEPEIAEWSEHFRTAGEVSKLRATFEVVEPPSKEYAELNANMPLLEELSRSSDGRVFELSEVGELAELIASRSTVKEHRVSTPLQHSWWTLIFVAALLALEWLVRKSVGLV
jgi:hypothetical protein